MKYNKSAQAALEFLSTYGFAFLIILVMIGSLTYFGILSPDRLVPQRCTFPPVVDCYEYRLDRITTGNLNFSLALVNNMPTTIEFDSYIKIGSEYGGRYTSAQPANCRFENLQYVISPGSRATLHCSLNNAPPDFVAGGAAFPADGERVRFTVDLLYRETGRTYWMNLSGEVYGTLQ